MSYVLTAYVLDLAGLKSLIGSKDKSIIRDVEPMIEEAYEDDEEEADAQRAAVRALVMGEPLDPDNAARYGCALWNICRLKGEELLPDAWGGVRWNSVEACGLEELLTKTGPPVALPPNSDIPCIGYIQRDKVAQYVETAEKKKEESDGSGVVDLLDEYLGWLEIAQSKSKDIVFFYG
jgi:hypothetical protein